jgi:hypothetical protein
LDFHAVCFTPSRKACCLCPSVRENISYVAA